MTENPGKTRAGKPITDDLLEKLTAQAEEGFDVEETLRRRGMAPSAGRRAGELADAQPWSTVLPSPND